MDSNSNKFNAFGYFDNKGWIDKSPKEEPQSPSHLPPPGPEKKRKQKSLVWEHFTQAEEIIGGKIVRRATCIYCGSTLSCVSTSGTGHLRRHIHDHCKKVPHHLKGQQQISFTRSTSVCDSSVTPSNILMSENSNFIYNQQNMRDYMAKYVVATDQSFSFGDNTILEWFIQNSIQPAFERIPKDTLISDIIRNYEQMKSNIKNQLSEFNGVISFTSDIWMSCNERLGYVCVTSHYINSDWQLEKKIIAFRLLEYPHNSVTIYRELVKIFADYEVNDKILSITFDIASLNDPVIDLMLQYLNPPYGGKLFQIRCVCYIINLIAQEGLELAQNEISLISYAIAFISSSSSRLQQYYKLCKQMGLKKRKLKVDIKTRWNTTYLMLKSCEGYENAITQFFNTKQEVSQLTEYHWHVGFSLMNVLEPLVNSIDQCSSIYYPTTCLVLYCIMDISFIFKEYRHHEIVGHIAKIMEQKFRKYCEKIPILFALAVVLDPRAKLSGVKNLLEVISENLEISLALTIEEVKELLLEMYSIYEGKYRNTTNTSQPCSSLSSIKGKQRLWSIITKGKQSVGSSFSFGEFTNYLNIDHGYEIMNENVQFDILAWWKEHQKIYPILSTIARDLLTPPVSTVASELVFNAGGRVLDERRSNLNPSVVEIIMCMKDWVLSEFKMQNRVDDDIIEDFKNLDLDENENV